ncbi:MarR family winged helix-turn-helix transcriptional regulator [Actinomadura xylanilytica]|uniref:MarR family winged helix-turn-helix transcriptional regulator n=1 Tax=Actinomadura xylanilytica TaxID=887459 RepID=UPI00255AEB88|nr:MarR family transcriptional regulator [Actinomadura xylanilytica]MDL4773547.1 MarR family transcriptional regulator [Actinomadura xylanilytica]
METFGMIGRNLTIILEDRQEPVNLRRGWALGSHRHEGGALTFMVRRVWLNMRSAIGEELKAFGLSTSQYATLLMAEAQPGMSVADIAREVASSRQAANEMLGGLEAAGLIERRPNPSDRRTHRIHVTEPGQARLAEARIAVERREAELEAGFTAGQRAAIRDWLDGISEACG